MIELWGALKDALAATLNFFYIYVPPHNYGLAIILLTLMVRVLLLPLTVKQTRAMYEMQKVQPKLKALQAKHKNDKQKLQEEMMKFYSENKINPFGGCLPMLLQLPIMIALFRVLLEAKDLGKTPFLGMDLTMAPNSFKLATTAGLVDAIPYLIMIGLMVWTTYVPQKMLSQDPQQQRTMLIMAVFMAVIAWTLPAGVLLYWVVTNIWTMGQQYLTLKFHREAPAVAAGAGAGAGVGKNGGKGKGKGKKDK